METATPLSKTVKLSNEELGGFHRRVYEIVRRVENGNVPLTEAMAGMQRVIERTQMPEVRYTPHARPQEFPRLRRRELRRSTARLTVRLPQSLQRLRWPERNPERIIAELWEIECIPEACTNSGRTPIHAILGEGVVPTERDVQIINSTIQYLGTNCGMVFVRKFLGVSQIYVN